MCEKRKRGLISRVKRFTTATISRQRFCVAKDLREHVPGGLAQLVEHLPCKQGVSGSIPLTSTKTA